MVVDVFLCNSALSFYQENTDAQILQYYHLIKKETVSESASFLFLQICSAKNQLCVKKN